MFGRTNISHLLYVIKKAYILNVCMYMLEKNYPHNHDMCKFLCFFFC
jgi:hypothetical protein